MKNKYNEIMEKIEVTPEMSERILKNIWKTDIEIQSSKTVHFKKYKKIISTAACLVILFAVSFMLHKIINSPTKPPIQEIPDIKICESLSELSSVVGFEMLELNYLPFNFTQKEFKAYWKELAEIIYRNENNTVIFRMGQGLKDVSGDYSEYNEVKDIQMDFGTITLKGDKGAYNLVIWSQNDMSYSVQTIEPLSENLILKIVLSLK
ncbi:hypothetical protein SH2C18_37140 [Clostridium sediminicola]|uniref:DUF4367 domain-containing protein n=1 Tax=Clostridium sediminicola TaxID=3114879 RepID=UPI0031F26FAB